MTPDLLLTAGTAHERWMDLFLGHISTHFVWGVIAALLATPETTP